MNLEKWSPSENNPTGEIIEVEILPQERDEVNDSHRVEKDITPRKKGFIGKIITPVATALGVGAAAYGAGKMSEKAPEVHEKSKANVLATNRVSSISERPGVQTEFVRKNERLTYEERQKEATASSAWAKALEEKADKDLGRLRSAKDATAFVNFYMTEFTNRLDHPTPGAGVFESRYVKDPDTGKVTLYKAQVLTAADYRVIGQTAEVLRDSFAELGQKFSIDNRAQVEDLNKRFSFALSQAMELEDNPFAAERAFADDVLAQTKLKAEYDAQVRKASQEKLDHLKAEVSKKPVDDRTQKSWKVTEPVKTPLTNAVGTPQPDAYHPDQTPLPQPQVGIPNQGGFETVRTYDPRFIPPPPPEYFGDVVYGPPPFIRGGFRTEVLFGKYLQPRDQFIHVGGGHRDHGGRGHVEQNVQAPTQHFNAPSQRPPQEGIKAPPQAPPSTVIKQPPTRPPTSGAGGSIGAGPKAPPTRH